MAGPAEIPNGKTAGTAIAFKELRAKLNSLNYWQPLSEESLGLAQRLLADILQSAEKFQQLERQALARDRETKASEEELRRLRWENPRLLKENTELHRRLLSDSYEHEDQRKVWTKNIDAVESEATHLKLLLQHEDTKTLETQKTLSVLKMQLTEIRRLDLGVGDGPPRPRCPSITLKGMPPSAGVNGEAIETEDETVVVGEDEQLASEVDDLMVEMATERQRRAEKAFELKDAQARSSSALSELRRLVSYDTVDDDGEGRGNHDAAVNSLTSNQESQLISQNDFLERTCNALRAQNDDLEAHLSAATNEVLQLLHSTSQLRQEIEVVQQRTKHLELEAINGSGTSNEEAATWAREHQNLRVEEAALQEAKKQLSNGLQASRRGAVAKSQVRAEDIRLLREQIDAERLKRPVDEVARLEEQIEASSRDSAGHRARCADLSARLMALRTHEAAQQRLLEMRVEEASASRRAFGAGASKVGELDAQVQDSEANLLGLRGEASELQACLEATTAEHASALKEVSQALQEESSLKREAEARQEAQERIFAELEVARAGTLQADEQAAETRRMEEELRTATLSFQRSCSAAKARLVSVEGSRSQRAADLGRVIDALTALRATSRSGRGSDVELEHRLQDARKRLHETEDMQRCRLADAVQEEQNLAAAVAAARSALDASKSEESKAQEEIERRLYDIAPGVEDLRQELTNLQAQNQRLADNLRKQMEHATADDVASHEARCTELEAALEVRVENCTTEAAELRRVEDDVSRLRAMLLRLEAEINQRGEAVRQAEGQVSELQVTVTSELRQYRTSEALAATSQARLEDVQEAERAAAEGLKELQVKQQQLLGLQRSLDEAQQQMARELQVLAARIQEEENLVHETLQGPPSVRQKLQELGHEIRRVRQTVQSVDAEQFDLRNISEARSRQLTTLRSEASQLQARRSELQWTLDKLRHASDLHHGELASSVRDLDTVASELKTLEQEAIAVQGSARERMKEVTLRFDDLMQMNRENQLLQGELQQARQRAAMLDGATKEHRAQAPARLQELRGTDLQRDTVLRAYQQALEERQRNAIAISEVSTQAATARLEVESLELRLHELRISEEAERSKLVDRNAGLLAMRAKLSTAARTLEMQEIANDGAGAERARLRLAIGARQASMSEAFLGDVVAETQVESLRTEVETLQRDLDEARGQLAATKQRSDSLATNRSKLQEMLLHHRRTQQRLEAEGSTLLQQLHIAAANPLALPAPDPAAEPLLQTLEKQTALLSDMTSERDILEKEVEHLTSELRAMQEQAGAYTPVMGEPAQTIAA